MSAANINIKQGPVENIRRGSGYYRNRGRCRRRNGPGDQIQGSDITVMVRILRRNTLASSQQRIPLETRAES